MEYESKRFLWKIFIGVDWRRENEKYGIVEEQLFVIIIYYYNDD